MTGCPTGSIFRDPLGQVDIDRASCIGCFDCATQCPYDAITMVPREERANGHAFMSRLARVFSFRLAEPAALGPADDVVAIKCNLCQGTSLNPAGARRQAYSCEENCPTGALVRVDPVAYFEEVQSAQGFVFRDETHAIGRNIHKSDPAARAWHILGIATTLLLIVATVFGLIRFGFDVVIAGTWLTMRWLTGLTGLAGIAIVMTYPLRKQIYRRRVGALRYWMLVHIYAGVAAGLVLLLHSGPRLGGLLTSLLYFVFDLVIASGVLGTIAYIVAPRIMTRIEGEPLLVEDLEARREELKQQAAQILERSEGWLKEEIRDRVYPRFSSRAFLWRQLWRREELKSLLAQAREEFKPRTTRLATHDERELLLSAVETAVTSRRVDALLLLHRTLRSWIPIHVVSTAVMLALLVAHVVQVIFFNAR
jgi:Fe-S-cluster-containing hydrogenase component 2